MNILLINGSPKGERSNTLRLANAFLEGICYAQKDCLPKFERLNIAQMDINSCLGCFSCWKTTPGKCCIYDDMQIVLEKLLWADLTIWSLSVCSPCAMRHKVNCPEGTRESSLGQCRR